MKLLKKLSVLLFAVMMLIPSFAFAAEYDKSSIENEIKETIDFSDREIFGKNFMTRSAKDFAVYHRSKDRLSMADDAFDKNQSVVIDNGDSFTFKFYLQPVKKVYLGTEYWADCTEIKFMTKDGKQEADYTVKELGKKKAVNNEKKLVPKGLEITVSKKHIVEKGSYGFPHYYRIQFETNLEDSGALGAIGDKMMNRNARLFVK